MDDLNRQLRIAIFAFIIIIPVGTVGFSVFEGWSLLDAAYATVITLSTIGYGDQVPATETGKVFAMLLAISGLSAFAFAGQAIIQVVTSPLLRDARQRRKTQRAIDKLNHHYIICGMGEIVNQTIEYLLQGANTRRRIIQEQQYQPFDDFLDTIFGDDKDGYWLWLRRPLHRFVMWFLTIFQSQATLLDIVVVITQDADYAKQLRNQGLLVLVGNPTDDTVLKDAGIFRAQAMMVLLDNDTETLLTVLTANSLYPALHTTAAVLDDNLSQKMTRVGANAVITPYDTAGQFLNNATLRPAVNDYFNTLLFEHSTHYRLTQLPIYTGSHWIGQSIANLQLHERYNTGLIGIRYADARYDYTPADDHIISEDEILIIVAPAHHIRELKQAAGGVAPSNRLALWQPLPKQQTIITSDHSYSLVDAEAAIETMSKHFIICAGDRVARHAIQRLDPERPFVIISNDNTLTSTLLKRGFRVVHGNPTVEETLRKAGANRAQAMMVALEEKADSILTILTSRTLNKQLLITATANTDDMIEKLERAGADRVVSPFHVAARFILLTTTRPELAGFVGAVLYNYQTGLETTEIYMEDDSVWIGKTIGELSLRATFEAGVIAIRQAKKQGFIHAPPDDYTIQPHDVLIIVTPMSQADALRDSAHGGTLRRPTTLRSRVLQSARWTPDEIQQMLKRAEKDQS